MATRLGWLALVGGLLAQAATYIVAMVISPEAPLIAWLAVLGIAATLTGTLVLGAARGDTLSRPAKVAALSLFVILVGCFAAAMLLPPEGVDGPLWLGLPRRAAIVLFGVGVLPMLILATAYAMDTRGDPLDAEALAELHRECARLRAEDGR